MKRIAKTMEGDLKRLLHHQPGFLIRRLHQASVAIFQQETAGLSITPDQYALIAAVSLSPDIDQLRLANAIGLDRTTVSGLVERLEAKGLVVRSICERDRRAKLVRLTSRGAALFGSVADMIDCAQKRILAPLTRQERKVFMTALLRLTTEHHDVAGKSAAKRTQS